MITCKEGLRNTQASGDLVVPFQELAFKLGIGWSPNGNDMVVRENYGVIVCRDFGHGLELAHRHNLKEGLKRLTLSDLKPTKQYAVLHKGGSYSFQSDKPIGDDVVACFDLVHSEKPLGEDFFDKKPRTKVEFVKVTDSIFDLRDEFERGELYFHQGCEYLPYKLEAEFAHGFMHNRIYRKIEKEIDERQEFIEVLEDIWFIDGVDGEAQFKEIVDSGKFKLVN